MRYWHQISTVFFIVQFHSSRRFAVKCNIKSFTSHPITPFIYTAVEWEERKKHRTTSYFGCWALLGWSHWSVITWLYRNDHRHSAQKLFMRCTWIYGFSRQCIVTFWSFRCWHLFFLHLFALSFKSSSSHELS